MNNYLMYIKNYVQLLLHYMEMAVSTNRTAYDTINLKLVTNVENLFKSYKIIKLLFYIFLVSYIYKVILDNNKNKYMCNTNVIS